MRQSCLDILTNINAFVLVAPCDFFKFLKRVMLSKIRVAAGRMGKATHCLLKRPFTKSMRPWCTAFFPVPRFVDTVCVLAAGFFRKDRLFWGKRGFLLSQVVLLVPLWIKVLLPSISTISCLNGIFCWSSISQNARANLQKSIHFLNRSLPTGFSESPTQCSMLSNGTLMPNKKAVRTNNLYWGEKPRFMDVQNTV